MADKLVIHSSRSRYEAYNKCMRYGYLNYNYAGRGIVPRAKNIFLETGIAVHKGLELIGKWLMKNKATEVREDVLHWIGEQVVNEYFERVFPKAEREKGVITGFNLIEEGVSEFSEDGQKKEFSAIEKQRLQQETFNEQAALVEALIRVFVMLVLPIWMKKFRIVTVENDMAFDLYEDDEIKIVQSAKLDWVLQEIESKDIYIVSFKSARQYDEYTKKQASHDTQGISETWAFNEFLKAKGSPRKVEGVLMLYLVKGARRETKRGSGIYKQASPLIRGYRKLTESGIEYAHSMYFPNKANDSGFGRLGKGWEAFDILTEGKEIGYIRGWLEMLAAPFDLSGNYRKGFDVDKAVQLECGNILAEQVVQPIPFARQESDIESWLRQTTFREVDIAYRLKENKYSNENGSDLAYMDAKFPQNRLACHYYPGEWNDCPYLSVCHGSVEERTNPLGTGEYTYRESHHRAELIQIEGETKGK